MSDATGYEAWLAEDAVKKARLQTDGEWRTFTSFAWVGRRADGINLAVQVARSDTDEPWDVVAIESRGTSLEQVFDAHAHKVIGRRDDLLEALAVAQTYGREWLATDSQEQHCACGEIDHAI